MKLVHIITLLRSILILSSHLCLGLSSDSFLWVFRSLFLCTAHLSHACYMSAMKIISFLLFTCFYDRLNALAGNFNKYIQASGYARRTTVSVLSARHSKYCFKIKGLTWLVLVAWLWAALSATWRPQRAFLASRWTCVTIQFLTMQGGMSQDEVRLQQPISVLNATDTEQYRESQDSRNK
jgi:hypothetical protein